MPRTRSCRRVGGISGYENGPVRSRDHSSGHEWQQDCEDEWGAEDDWGEIGHTLKLAALSPITTWTILGQAIWGEIKDEEALSLLLKEQISEEAQRLEREAGARQGQRSRSAQQAVEQTECKDALPKHRQEQGKAPMPHSSGREWLQDWEDEWGTVDDWGEEAGHTLKLAALSPITTWKILGQAISGEIEDEEAVGMLEREAGARHA